MGPLFFYSLADSKYKTQSFIFQGPINDMSSDDMSFDDVSLGDMSSDATSSFLIK